MSGYVLKLGGAPTGPRAYACPEHGVFELEVDLATSAEPRPCPAWPMVDANILSEDEAVSAGLERCGRLCERAVAAALYKPQRGALVRGKYEARGRPMDLDTRPLADGTSPKEFKKQRAAKWFAHDMDEAKRKGLT